MFRHLEYHEIEAAADRFLAQYHPPATLPIPVEEIIEFELGWTFVPVRDLFNNYKIDGFRAGDQLFIDAFHFEEGTHRSRFTMAHEIGHFVLHPKEMEELNIQSLEDWMRFMLGKGDGHAFAEQQADMFAGALLLPSPMLELEFDKQRQLLREHTALKGVEVSDSMLAKYAATRVAKPFSVSDQVASTRLLQWLECRRQEKEAAEKLKRKGSVSRIK